MFRVNLANTGGSSNMNQSSSNSNTALQTGGTMTIGNASNMEHSQQQPQQQQQLLPTDLELAFDSIQADSLDVDVNEVLRHELSFDGSLDFNFDPVGSVSQMNNSEAFGSLKISQS